MIGDVKIMGNDYYFQVNRKGTLRKLPPATFWRRFWIELKNCFTKWNEEELVYFATNGFNKRKKWR